MAATVPVVVAPQARPVAVATKQTVGGIGNPTE
jgi:hypothetical protein